jgi:hypothetical protein
VAFGAVASKTLYRVPSTPSSCIVDPGEIFVPVTVTTCEATAESAIVVGDKPVIVGGMIAITGVVRVVVRPEPPMILTL